MGLFSIFKKKAEQGAMQVPPEGIDALAEGVWLEDEHIFLRWGADIEADKLYMKKEYRADRTIYHWGDRVVLQGLKIPLKTVCWNHKQHGDVKSIESVEFLTEGTSAAVFFADIKRHLEIILGEAKVHDDLQPGDLALEWKVKAVKVALKFFNKEKPKVHFEMGWWL
jgi:hypothetical protein